MTNPTVQPDGIGCYACLVCAACVVDAFSLLTALSGADTWS